MAGALLSPLGQVQQRENESREKGPRPDRTQWGQKTNSSETSLKTNSLLQSCSRGAGVESGPHASPLGPTRH